MEKGSGTDGMLWGLVGCAGLLFLVLLAACGVGGYLVLQRGIDVTPSLPTGPESPPPPDAPVPRVRPPRPPRPDAPRPRTPSYPDKPPPPASEVRLGVRVTSVTGGLSGRVLASCEVVVRPPSESTGNCHAHIDCEGLVLYGEGSTGYLPCRFDGASGAVSGRDSDTHEGDGDAAVTIDTAARVLSIVDDASSTVGAYTLEGTF